MQKTNFTPPATGVKPVAAAPPVYRVQPAVSQLRPGAGKAAADRHVPPVFRPGAATQQHKPVVRATAPPVYRPTVAAATPVRPGVLQRQLSAEQAEQLAKTYPMKVNDLQAYIQDLRVNKKMPKEYTATQEEDLMIGKALINVGLQAPKKKEKDDIVKEFNPRYACVLQTVIYIKANVFGKTSAKDLHDLIWSDKDKSKAQYQQYDDDSVTPSFYVAAGLTAKVFPKGATMDTLPDDLPAGKYAIGVKGSVEDHMYILVKTGKEFEWKEYDQINQKGFKDARVSKNGEIKSVYG